MPLDPMQFLQTFIDESLEMLQDMEQAVLDINLDSIDPDKINVIFRAVHSLKSSGALLGFDSISEFNHALENYLQLIRSGERSLTQNDLELLLACVDCNKNMIADVVNKRSIKTATAKKLGAIFSEMAESGKSEEQIRNEPEAKKNSAPKIKPQEKSLGDKGWLIKLVPNQDIFENGTDPIRFLSALSELGKIDIKLDGSAIPLIDKIDPASNYLRWTVKLLDAVDKKDIEELFSWISDSIEYEIVPLAVQEESSVKEEKIKIDAPSTKPIESPVIKEFKKPGNLAIDLPPEESVRISTKKVDNLIDLIGELIITQSTLNQITKNFTPDKLNKLSEVLAHLEFNSRNIQDGVLGIRMLPITFAFKRIPRYVHDMANKAGKKVDLIIHGEQTEIDKNMMEKIFNPMIHLVRNAIDHGIEMPNVRQSRGKPIAGIINISAFHEKGMISIVIQDDGSGLNVDQIRTKAIQNGLISENDKLTDNELYQLIFKPGFSTSDMISDVSGRGVGLDVVYRTVKQLNGSIEIESVKEQGAKFILRLPITLSIMDCQLVKIGKQVFTIPLIGIIENIQIDTSNINRLDYKSDIYLLREECIPIIDVGRVFNIAEDDKPLDQKYLIITEVNNKSYGLVVDNILDQQQVVIKNLDDNYYKITGIAGATILGDGSVSLIIDTSEIVNMFQRPEHKENGQHNYIKSDNDSEPVSEEIVETENKNFQFITFMLSNQLYGLDILEVREIVNLKEITPMPNSPSFIRGLFNLRGTIIPIMDLHNYFDIEKNTGKDKNKTNIIILSIKHESDHCLVGIIVDSVHETYTIPYEIVKQVPERHRAG